MQHVHFQVRVAVFSCQDNYLFRIVVKKTNRTWFSVVSTLIDNETGHHIGQNVLNLRGAAK